MATPESKPEAAVAAAQRRPWYRNRWLIGGVAAVALYAALGFLLVPNLVRHYVPKTAAEQFQRQASIGEVRFNPFLFKFEAKDFVFREADGAPIFALKRLFVDFELESLFRWAWTFADVRLEGPTLNLVVGEDDRLNLAKVLDALPKSAEQQPAEKGPPPRVLIKNVALTGGKVSFTDRSNPTHATAVVEPIALAFDDISTLPERRGPYAVTAQLPGGGTLGWKGEVSLQPIASSGTLRFDGFKPATLWKFVQDRVRLAEPAGDIDVAVSYKFAYAAGTTTLIADPIQVKVNSLALAETGGGAPILELGAIELPSARFDLAARELVVPALSIRDGRAAARVDTDGTVNWATLVKAVPSKPIPAEAKSPASPAAAPWKVRVESFKLDEVALDYRDASRAVPVTVTVGASKLALAAAAEVGGGAPQVKVENLSAGLDRVAWTETSGGEPLLTLQSVALEGGTVDLAPREVRLERVTLTGGAAQIKRAADGTVRQLTAFGPAEGKIRRELAAAGEAAAAEGQPWKFALDELALANFAIGLSDEGTQPPVQYDLEGINVVVKDVSNDGKTPLKVDAKLGVRQGGSLAANATVSPTGESAEAEVKLARFALKPLAPMVAKFATLTLESGDVSGTTKLAYRAGKAGPSVKATGAVSVGNLLLQEADTRERFLSWKALSANGIDFSLGPDKLVIREVRLLEPGAKIVIFKDRSVNLVTVLKRDETPETRASAAETSGGRAAPFPVSVERIRVENATVDFADLSLVLPFATEIRELKGAATGISSDPKSRASLKFEGRVGEFGDAAVDGSLAPFAPKQFTDIGVVFRNVAMTPLSPYTATFAGRKIASGKLSLDLQYKIANSELLGQNKVLLQEFTLGEKVESENAVNLPLDLAVALLTDSEGKIDLAVPVTGNVDDPEFSYGGVIWQAIVNVITKIVTAPFRALGAALGGDAESLDAVAFQPGRAELAPPEQEKLKKVAGALAKRPQLKVIVHGAFDPVADGAALKDRNLRLALAQKLGVSLAPGEDPGPVAYDDAKTQRALEALLTERGGEKAMAEFQAAFEKQAGRPAKRVNAALALIGQGSEDHDFYAALFAHLVETAPKPDAQLQALAENRSAAVAKALTSVAGLDAARVAVGKTEIAEAKDKAVPSKLELGVL
jgi:uncharacterized protein involved in outer membrane biogenesis